MTFPCDIYTRNANMTTGPVTLINWASPGLFWSEMADDTHYGTWCNVSRVVTGLSHDQISGYKWCLMTGRGSRLLTSLIVESTICGKLRWAQLHQFVNSHNKISRTTLNDLCHLSLNKLDFQFNQYPHLANIPSPPQAASRGHKMSQDHRMTEAQVPRLGWV